MAIGAGHVTHGSRGHRVKHRTIRHQDPPLKCPCGRDNHLLRGGWVAVGAGHVAQGSRGHRAKHRASGAGVGCCCWGGNIMQESSRIRSAAAVGRDAQGATSLR